MKVYDDHRDKQANRKSDTTPDQLLSLYLDPKA